MNIRQIDVDGLSFDQQNLVLLRRDDSGDKQSTKLDSLTANLLCCFLDHPDTVLSREQLIEQVWTNQHTSDNAVNRSVSVLRKALGPNDKQYISTISKVGYRFNAHTIPTTDPNPEHKLEPQTTPIYVSPAPEAMFLPLPPPLAVPLPPPIATLVTSEKSDNQSKQLIFWVLLALLFSVAVVNAIANSSIFIVNEPVAKTISQTKQKNVLTISVQPFANLSDEPQQHHFIHGLDEQMLNHLTRIPGLILLKQTALNADYQLQGSVDKRGDTLRINAQLIETATNSYLFSISFDRQLTNVFDIQAKVAQQVAAALKLSLIYKNQQYSSALTRLDHLAVEQLVIARAKINQHTTASIIQALDSLNSLNRQFEETPEIMGLLAKAWLALAKKPGLVADYQPENTVTLAKKTLALQPTNLDALKALYYYYARYPQHREQSFALSETLVRYHPGQTSAWRSHLHQMLSSVRPCNEISNYVDSIPKGVFTKHRLTAIRGILNHCLQSTPLKKSLNFDTAIKQKKFKKAIYNNLYFFAIPNDLLFKVFKERHLRLPRTQNTLNYYWAQLAAGANKGAAVTAKTISKSNNDYAISQSKLFATVYDIDKSAIPLNFDHLQKMNSKTFYFSAALIAASKQSGDGNKVADWLATKPIFPITLFNRTAAIELMMLQYHSGQYEQSQNTAKLLFDKFTDYYQQHQASYLFWGLGGKHLIAQMYCGEACNTPDVMPLEQWFKPDHAWWVDDIAMTRLALSPFAQSPVVVDYLNRIEQDRSRVRQKFGLM